MPPRKKPAKVEEETVFRFQLEGKPYEIDAATLTWGEIEDLEIYFGEPYEDVDLNSGRGVMFLAYIARKRVEPSFTLDAMRKLPLTAFQEVETETRPTVPAAGISGAPS